MPNVHLALKVKCLLKLHLQKVTFPQEFAIEVYYTLKKKLSLNMGYCTIACYDVRALSCMIVELALPINLTGAG